MICSFFAPDLLGDSVRTQIGQLLALQQLGTAPPADPASLVRSPDQLLSIPNGAWKEMTNRARRTQTAAPTKATAVPPVGRHP